MSAVPLSPSHGGSCPAPQHFHPQGSPSLECCAQQLFPVGLGSSSAPQEWFGATTALFSCWLGDVVQVGGDFFFSPVAYIRFSVYIYIILQCYSMGKWPS